MTADEARVPTYADHDVDVAREQAHAAVERLASAAREAADAAARRAAPAPAPAAAARSPGAGVTEPLDADSWWAQLPPARRSGICHWITQRDHRGVEGQLDALVPTDQPDHPDQHEET